MKTELSQFQASHNAQSAGDEERHEADTPDTASLSAANTPH